MINPPRTKAEAKKVRYNTWAGNPKGYAYNPEYCAHEVKDRWFYLQCAHKPGKGPDNLYCGIHAKKVKL